VTRWITDLLRRRRLEQDLAEEIQQHLDEKTEALIADGMSVEDAAAAARRAFGNVTHIEEQARGVWRLARIEDVLADVRFALRQLRKSPAFALAAVLTLALCIGANATVFSLVSAVILRPLPYPEPDRLVSVKSRDIRGTPHPTSLSYPTFFDFRAENKVFEHLVSYRDEEFSVTGTGLPIQVRGQIVSWDLFAMLQVQPALGRGFLPHEEQAGERVVVLSQELWRSRFGGDPKVVGTTVMVDSQPHTIVGVAAPRFAFPLDAAPTQIWTTVARDATSATFTPVTEQRGARMLHAMARLKPGVSIEQAQAQMDTVAASLAARYPDTNKAVPGAYVRPELDNLVGDARLSFFILLGAVGLVLVVACANIANLLLAHTDARAHEFAMRAAIGAGHGRIVRQLITESLTLAMIGTTAGLLVAGWSIRLFRTLPIPRIGDAVIDGRVLAFSLALAVVTSVLFGLAPALRAASTGFTVGVREASRTSTAASDHLRSGLCVAQVALGLVLLSGAGLLIGSFLHLVGRDLGFRPDGLLTFRVGLPGYTQPRQLEFHAGLLDRLRGLPAVTGAALAMPLPLAGSQMTVSFDIQQRPAPPPERPRSNMAIVTPGFFRTIGVPLIEGRDFTERDGVAGPPVVIVNRAFADRFFPGEDALGKRIKPGATADDRGPQMREIVGIVGNARQSALAIEEEPIYYFAYQQMPWCCPAIVVRSAVAPSSLQPAIRDLVASLDKQLPIYSVRTSGDLLSMAVAAPRFQVMLLGSFAAMALLLTVVGLYGLLASSVVVRTREIGVRLALGATRQQVLGIVLRRAMLLLLLGISIGTAGAYAGNHFLRMSLHAVAPDNMLLISVASLVLMLTGMTSAYWPARRAASIDPIRALRAD
jgi:putative ABC transport system permease protein